MDIRTPHTYPRRILLCVAGLSPQIITESLYALAVQQTPTFIPTEIHLITTTEGARRARLFLLSNDQGQFYRLCADYGLNPAAIRFDDSTIHLIPDSNGQSLADIRSEADNAAAADAIMHTVRTLTADANAAVHASIAGGRKTMGFFLGYAMSLLGRPHDRLSHVLVSSPFESHPEFFFPPKTQRVLIAQPNNQPVDTAEAVITLADIPFVRLRDAVDDELLHDGGSYSETVHRTQANLEPVELVLDLDNSRIRCGGQILKLAPRLLALLALLAQRLQQGQPGILRGAASGADNQDFLSIYNDLPGSKDTSSQKVAEQGLEPEQLQVMVSKLNRQIKNQLGKHPAKPYLVRPQGARARKRYELSLRAEQVRRGRVE